MRESERMGDLQFNTVEQSADFSVKLYTIFCGEFEAVGSVKAEETKGAATSIDTLKKPARYDMR